MAPREAPVTNTHPTPPRPVGEHDRLRELYRRRLLGTGHEQVFDDVTALAGFVTGAPVALLNLIDADVVEPKAALGADPPSLARELAVCSYTILGQVPVVIADLTRDVRTRANPVLAHFGVRFYAGVPVVVEDQALGALCVFDTVTRSISVEQLGALEALGRQAAALILARGARQALGDVMAQRERGEADLSELNRPRVSAR